MVAFLVYLRDEVIKKRVVDPTVGLLQKLGGFIKKVYLKVVEKIEWLLEKIKKGAKKGADFTVRYSKIAY